MAEKLELTHWDVEYEKGRYASEAPIPFVGRIVDELGENGKRLFGLYPGCGNGRNFIPLLEAGLDVRGLDSSAVGIKRLLERCPEAEGRVRTDSFENLAAARIFDYVVAIQIFQHGDERETRKFFSVTRDALKPGGQLFLRVNSVSTEIYEDHHVIETNPQGGFTVLYESGPKQGLNIHFYSQSELQTIAEQFGFDITGGLRETTEQRQAPQTGTWTQWESIWQKR